MLLANLNKKNMNWVSLMQFHIYTPHYIVICLWNWRFSHALLMLKIQNEKMREKKFKWISKRWNKMQRHQIEMHTFVCYGARTKDTFLFSIVRFSHFFFYILFSLLDLLSFNHSSMLKLTFRNAISNLCAKSYSNMYIYLWCI